eukprot:GHVN01083790.1.p1 GENE.GHVN01083790.1~~GHVN01083790.1.p1  ORF type:complete len:404 (+),score=6.49 GHVN01083790.1:134-1345(+)
MIAMSAWKVMFVVACCSAATISRAAPPCLQQVNEDGFGDSMNKYTWSMATFKGGLYAGTLNTQFWNKPEEIEGMEDPRDLHRLISDTDGAEIWRYYGQSWTKIISVGFGNKNNKGIRNLYEHTDGNLYAGTANYLDGAEIWRSSDGDSWTNIAREGFGRGNGSARGMVSFRGALYVGTENSLFGGEIWRWDGYTWVQVVDGGISSRRNLSIGELTVWQDLLYAFTWNAMGFEIFVYDGTDFKQVASAGISNKFNSAGLGVAVYNDRIYVGTANYVTGAELYRSNDGFTFERIASKGLGDIKQAYLWRLFESNGLLYIGTVNQGPIYAPVSAGGNVYRMDKNEQLEELVGPVGSLAEAGFGDWRNYGIRTMAGKIYFGTAQCFFCVYRPGTNVWALDNKACTSS